MSVDVLWLRDKFRQGLERFLEDESPRLAPLRISLFQALDADLEAMPWFRFLDEQAIGEIFDGMKNALKQLGYGTEEIDQA